jgi:predicted GNAT superfamily acetyltransferase
VTTTKPKPAIVIRDLATTEDIRELEPVEREVWGLHERDVTPMTLLIACKEAGAILIGAFDGTKMVGFAFAFPALDEGKISFHSHMLAVLPEYRDSDLGYKLKLAQRERALRARITEMTWTFDPLQSRNAHFNFAKVGVVSDRYKVDFYGRNSSSVLHQNGTDRLWVTWLMDSRRVLRRIEKAIRPEPLPTLPALVRFNGDGRPVRSDLSEALARQRVIIEIPGDILQLEQKDHDLAREWRLATRWAFVESLRAGFFVAEYHRSVRGQQGPGAYLLQAGELADVAEI